MTVHIGIVTFNSLRDLPACFDGIRSQTYSPLSINIVDNASTDGSADWIGHNAPQITLIQNSENIGFSNAHNQIIKTLHLAENDYYLALNPDVILQPEYIRAIVHTIRSDDTIGWATGKLLFPVSEDLPESRIYSVGHALFRNGYAINIGHQMVDRGQFGQSREVFGASGAAVLMKSTFVHDLCSKGALFDPDMFMYGEDVDLDWRGQKRGWKCLYSPDAIASHRGSSPPAQLRTQAILNRYLSVIKNADSLTLAFYNMPIIACHCLFRIILTPRQGGWLLWSLIRRFPRKIRQRQPSTVPKSTMQTWFKWAAQQPTNQPTSFVQRLRDFFHKLI